MWMSNPITRKVSHVTIKQWLAILACLIVGANLFLTRQRTIHREILNSDQDLNLTVNGAVSTENSVHGNLSGKYDSEEKVKQAVQEKTESYFLPLKFPNDWMKNQENIYQQRNDRIREVCQRHKVGQGPVLPAYMLRLLPGYPLTDEDPPIERPNRQNAFLLRSMSILACSQPKVGSSSVIAAFNLANGRDVKYNERYSFFPKSKDEFLQANETYFKFMFVRHPIERLLSAYIDKMVVHPNPKLPGFPEEVQQKGQAILANRAKSLGQKMKRRLGLASQGLHSHITQKREVAETNNHTKRMSKLGEIYNNWKKEQSRKKTDIMAKLDTNSSSSFTGPTFEEFLEYILSTDLHGLPDVEGHWEPYWRRCSPCHLHYDVIGKTETTKEDFTYIWQRTGLDERVPVPWLNKKPVSNEKIRRMHYYASLPRELILRVYQRYHLDFEMFEYSINDVLTQAGYQPIADEEYVKHL